MNTPPSESSFTKEQLDYFLQRKVEQVIDASKRTIYPYAGLVVFCFILLSHVYISNFGWTKHQMSDIDESITNAINGVKAASNCSRIERYHFGMSQEFSLNDLPLAPFFEVGIPLSEYDNSLNVWNNQEQKERIEENFLKSALKSILDTSSVDLESDTAFQNDFIKPKIKAFIIKVENDSTLIFKQLQIEKEALLVLKKERKNLIDQRSREQTIEVPILGIYLNLGDLGVLGQFGLILLLIFYYACVRRELHALNEFTINVRLKKVKKRYVIFSEPNFSPKHYYLAFESFNQYFVFISATKRLKLGKYNTLLMFFPSAVVAIALIVDSYDLVAHYHSADNSGQYNFRLYAQFIFTSVVIFLNFRNFLTQLKVTRTLRAFSDVSKGYLDKVRFQDLELDVITSPDHVILNGIVEIIESKEKNQPKVTLQLLTEESKKKEILDKLSEKDKHEVLTWSESAFKRVDEEKVI